MKSTNNIQAVKRLLKIQLGITSLIALVCCLTIGKNAGLSSLLGGIVVVIPSLLFAKTLFRYSGASAAKRIANSFYLGEAWKIISTVFLFALVFLLFNIEPKTFFFTYIVILMSHWFAPLVLITNRKAKK